MKKKKKKNSNKLRTGHNRVPRHIKFQLFKKKKKKKKDLMGCVYGWCF